MSKSKFAYDEGDVAGLIVTDAEDSASPSEPRSLARPEMLARRRGMLDSPHILPLRDYALELRSEGRGFVPDLDPMDGGIEARFLFLLEKPGPMTDPARTGKPGSGFVSRDNDDPTAAAIFSFMQQAAIPRKETVIWNTIPWWNGVTDISGREWPDGLARLEGLMTLLPKLEAAVLIGRKAQRARRLLEAKGLAVWASAHPSPRVKAGHPALYRAIPEIWAEAARGHV
ncbi:uracil-DNA glycosylase [Paracoccus litorisediminis]|uniref:uracil-DNA glycosylase n=1 Tax=Paracoccus litorisediminis TaxID=2006130 RepID=UPI0037327B2A